MWGCWCGCGGLILVGLVKKGCLLVVMMEELMELWELGVDDLGFRWMMFVGEGYEF